VNKLWARVPYTKRRENAHINMCPEALDLGVIAERVFKINSQNVLHNIQ
jgi:hypothetical protein